MEEERLRLLREKYARGEIDLARLEIYAEQVLQGEQPHDGAGLSIMADPDLYNYVQIG